MITRALALSFAWLLLLACSRDGGGARTARPVPIRAAPAVEKDVPVEIRAVGKIVANRSVAIRAQVSGPIVAIHFQEGQAVREGALLVEIDPRPLEAALLEATARLEQDRARAENARMDAERYAGLVEREFVTRQQYEAARANAQALQAAVLADEAAVERASLALSYARIRAPISGRTGKLLVHPGNLVTANGPEPLVTIEQVKPVFAEFSVPERHVAALRAERAAPPPVSVRTSGGGEALGKLTFMNNTVDSVTGTILLKAEVPNADEALWPGQIVDVRVRVAERTKAVVVPSGAVATGQQGDYAFVVTADEKAEFRPVEVAQAGDVETVIAKGISAGEVVVTEGLLKLRPGTAVEILEEKPKASP